MVYESTSHPTVLVGHPFAPIGMGEHLRSAFRALRAAQVEVRVLDVYGVPNPDLELHSELDPFLTNSVGQATAIFCINGDEVERILAHLGDRAVGGPRIIYPAWELPRYPVEWARQLERFNEVWSASAYTAASIGASVDLSVWHLPLATQARAPQPLGRRAFSIPESSYAFLSFFDFQSYIQRKNPQAALDAFGLTLAARPEVDLRFVLRVSGAAARPEQYEAFREDIRPFGDRVLVLDAPMRDAQVKALHVCCDAFVSLHRCEGFGFGLAEAMCFGKPTVATGYSGNMDFMTPETSHLVGYRLVSVPEGAYPHAAGQCWAEPDVAQAAAAMIRLADDPVAGRALGAAASRHVRMNFSYRAAGLRYAERLGARAASLTEPQHNTKPRAADAAQPGPGAQRARRTLTADAPRAVMPNYTHETIRWAEAAATTGQIEDVLACLRALSLDEFGRVVVSMPDPAFPGLSRVLPRMADEQVQKDWTGNSGLPLLLQTLEFVRSIESHFVRLTGRALAGSTILDYGCGYGRILRIMYYFTAPASTVGVDPWARSIEICRADGVPSVLEVSDYLPSDLPVGNRLFDLIYAFSVFTHTSERATRIALTTLRRYAKSDSVLAITIRPRNYWEAAGALDQGQDATAMLAAHDTTGFAFAPHDRAPVDGDVTYGDTSMNLDWLAEQAEGWHIAATDSSADDPMQSIVYLVPR